MQCLSLIYSCVLAVLLLSCSAVQEETECLFYKKYALSMNAIELFDAATVCRLESEKDLSAYFQSLGRIRGITDMSVYTPRKTTEEKIKKLHSELVYPFSRMGDDLVFKSPARYNDLINQIEKTSLSNGNGYSPGWDYKRSLITDLYDQLLSDAKQTLLLDLERHKRLLSNDDYFEAHRAANKLRAENQTLTVGTEAYEEYQRLNEVMRKAFLKIDKL